MGEAFLDSTRRDAEKAIQKDMQRMRQWLLDGMTLADQPEGVTNSAIRVSPDGQFAAFLSAKDGADRIIVVDRRTGAQTVVPAPEEQIFESRSIRRLEWGDDGQTLYVLEDATSGARTNAEMAALSEDQSLKQLSQIYQVFYAWQPGKPKAQVLDRVEGKVLSLAAGGGRARVLTESKQKGWGYIELRDYQAGKLASSQTFHVARNGESIDYFAPQLLSKRNEVWFTTATGKPQRNGGYRMWLAVMNLDAPGSEPRLVAPDVRNFAWSPDGKTLVIDKAEADDRGRPSQLSFYMMRHDALEKPVLLASKRMHLNAVVPSVAGFSPDGRTMYMKALAKPELASARELNQPGAVQIYQYNLPN